MATKYWRLTTGGVFLTAANWSLSSGGPANTTAPTTGDTLIFDRASTYTVTLGATFTAPSCTINVNAGSVTFSLGTYSLTIGTVTNSGTVTFASGSSGASLFNTFTNNGTCTFSGASTSVNHLSGYQSGGSFYNYGTLNITQTAGVNAITYGGSFYNYSGASTTVSGIGMYCSGNFINQGSLSFNAAQFVLGYNNGATYSGGASSYNVQTNGATITVSSFCYLYSGTTTNNSTFTLLDSLTIGGSLQIYAGYLNLNGQTVSCSAFSAGAANPKGMTLNGGSIYATGTTPFNNSATAYFTVTAGTGTCYYITTNSSAKTFLTGSSNGGWVYPWILLNSGGTLTLSGNYAVTFGGFQSSGTATITFTQGASYYLSNPGKIGDGSNYLTLSGGTNAANVSSIVWTGSGNPAGGLGALTISNISFGNLPDTTNGSTPFIWKLGSGSTNAGGMSGGAFIDHNQDAYLITNTGLTSWTLPSNWNPNNNQIYLIGGGGGGGGGVGVGTPLRHNGGGGGGGGYTLVSNYSGTAGSSVAITIGSGGSGGLSGPGSAGGSTTWASGAYVAGGGGGGSYSSGSGGSGGTGTYTGGTGGAVGSSISASYAAAGAGGGGAAGPRGNGGNGSYNVNNNTATAGGGGGGNGGGASASNATSATAAAGGNGWLGSGGGAVATSGINGGGGGGSNVAGVGGAGSEGTEILGVAGSAGGAGGSYASSSTNRSGTIGGGGGAGAASYTSNQTGGNGGQGLIVILNTYIASGTLLSTYCTGFDLYGTYADGAGGTYNALIAYNSATCGYAAAGGSSNFFNFF